jgi:hypothetical protein
MRKFGSRAGPFPAVGRSPSRAFFVAGYRRYATSDLICVRRLVQHELRNCKFFAGFIGDVYGDCMIQCVIQPSTIRNEV